MGNVMEAAAARNIAHYSHAGHRDRFGGLMTEHVERIAAHVPEQARGVAYLHDVLERTSTPLGELRAHGLTDSEAAALELLTQGPTESYEAYVLRIAYARGTGGELARAVKLAELDDHLAQAALPDGAPPHAWARRHIMNAQSRAATRQIAA